jgi:hypothetical protein
VFVTVSTGEKMSKSAVPTTATGQRSLKNGLRIFLFFTVVKSEKKTFFKNMALRQRAVLEVSRQRNGLILKGSKVFFNISAFLEK